MHDFDLFIPVPDSRLRIATASAIVAHRGDREGASRAIYYEGNVHGASNLHRYEERVNCAVGRLRLKYPTIARADVPSGALHLVGRARFLDCVGTIITQIVDPAALEAWLAPEALPPLLGSAELREAAASRRLRTLSKAAIDTMVTRSALQHRPIRDVIFESYILNDL